MVALRAIFAALIVLVGFVAADEQSTT
jgi:hypothetical protein